MPTVRRPLKGSKGYWPKKRARRIYPRVMRWPAGKDTKPLGFAAYKVGMTHIIKIETNPNQKTRGQEIAKPVTLLECPPLSVFGFRFYKKHDLAFKTLSEVYVDKPNKNLLRKIKIGKQKERKEPESFDYITILCHTNPNFKKKPEIFEMPIGGEPKAQLEYAKSILGKDIKIGDVFKEGDLVDVSSITKGKGFQGPVKRFGVKIHYRKSEQAHRKGGVKGTKEPGKIRSSVPQSGQLGFQKRTELNKKILKIADGKEVNPKGGFINYGLIKGECVMIEGSLPGPKKRLVRMRFPIRPKKTYPVDIKFISLRSKQGV